MRIGCRRTEQIYCNIKKKILSTNFNAVNTYYPFIKNTHYPLLQPENFLNFNNTTQPFKCKRLLQITTVRLTSKLLKQPNYVYKRQYTWLLWKNPLLNFKHRKSKNNLRYSFCPRLIVTFNTAKHESLNISEIQEMFQPFWRLVTIKKSWYSWLRFLYPEMQSKYCMQKYELYFITSTVLQHV